MAASQYDMELDMFTHEVTECNESLKPRRHHYDSGKNNETKIKGKKN